MYGLQLIGRAQAFTIAALQVLGGQDVRVFTSGARLAATFTGPIAVATAGSLVVRGSFSNLEFESTVSVQDDASMVISVNDGAVAPPAESALTLHSATTIGERSSMVIRAAVATTSFDSGMSTAATATVALSLIAEVTTFTGSVDTGAGSSLNIDGTVGVLVFLAGLHTGGTTTVRSASPSSIAVAMGTTWYAVDPSSNRGNVTFGGVGLLSTDGETLIGTADGTLPGAMHIELNGLQPGGDGVQTGNVLLGDDGTITIPPEVSAAVGQVFTDDHIAEFVSTVNAGGAGMYGLQLSADGQSFEVSGLSISSGQDVRIFASTASSTLSFAGELPLVVDDGGSLTISGTFALVTVDVMISTAAGQTMFANGVVVSEGNSLPLSETPVTVPTVMHPLGVSWSFVIADMGAVRSWALGDSDVALNVCLDGDAVSAGSTGCNGGNGCSTTLSIPAGELVISCNKPGGAAELCQVQDRLDIAGPHNSGAYVALHRLLFADLHTSGPPTTGSNAGGGAIELHGGALTIISCAFERNRVPYDSVGGGAISARPGSSHLTIIDSVFTSNDAACSRPWTTTGEALYVTSNGGLTISGCRFVSNHAAGNGGAIDLDVNGGPRDVTITTTTFESNRCDADGAAVHVVGRNAQSYSNDEATIAFGAAKDAGRRVLAVQNELATNALPIKSEK
eukprot:SAG11_NODE_309_length_10941_cov_5.580520_7_plen_679_part_00